jgi:hypothetical protein
MRAAGAIPPGCARRLARERAWGDAARGGRAEVPPQGDAISKALKAKCERVIKRNRDELPTAAAAK